MPEYPFSSHPLRVDRSVVRIGPLSVEEDLSDYLALTPEQRFIAVCQVTRDAWSFKEPGYVESGLQRNVVRIVRRGS